MDRLITKEIVSESKLVFMQGRYKESLRLAKQALDIDRKNPDAHQSAGNAYMSREDYESAIKAYKKAVEYEADNGDRYFNKWMAWRKLQKQFAGKANKKYY